MSNTLEEQMERLHQAQTNFEELARWHWEDNQEIAALKKEIVGLKAGQILAIHNIGCYGMIDGAHHKQWVLDEILRALLGKERYRTWIENYEDWDEGIAP